MSPVLADGFFITSTTWEASVRTSIYYQLPYCYVCQCDLFGLMFTEFFSVNLYKFIKFGNFQLLFLQISFVHCLFQTLEFQLRIYIYHIAWHGGLFLFIYCMEGTVVFICVFHFVIFFYLHFSSLCSCFNSEYSKIAILTFFTSSIIYALLKFRF